MADTDPRPGLSLGPFNPEASGLPIIYFNGFDLSSSLSDMSATLTLNGRSNVILCMSFTTAKTLAEELSKLVGFFETSTDHMVMNMEEVSKGYERASKKSEWRIRLVGRVFSRERDPLITRICSFAALPVGWCYGRGGPIRYGVLNNAIDVAEALRRDDVPKIEAFPYATGETLIVAVDQPYVAEIWCKGQGRFALSVEIAEEELPTLEGLSLADLHRELARVEWPSKRSSGYSTLNTIIMPYADLLAQRSLSRTTARQSLNRNVHV